MALIKNELPENRQEAEVILKYIHRRIENNKNFLCVTTGPVGAGKSWSNLRLAELWYKYKFNEKFDAEKNVVFGVDEFLRRLVHNKENKLRKGELLIFEEVGVNVNSRAFMSKINRAVNYIMQSFRSMNIVCLLNLPYISMLDKSVRMLMTAKFEVVRIDKDKGECIIKPFFCSVHRYNEKVLNKYLRVKDKQTGRMKKIDRCILHKPAQELVDVYEPRKRSFVDATILKGLEKVQASELEDRPKTLLDTGTHRQREAKRLFVEHKGNVSKVAESMGMSTQNIYSKLGGKEIIADLYKYMEDSLEKA